MDRDRHTEYRDKIAALLSEWSAGVDTLIDRLAATDSELDALREERQELEHKMQALAARAEGQAELIDVLRNEADEAHSLSATIRTQEQEIVALKSEIDSKQELVRVLRRDADAVERLKLELRGKDDAIGALNAKLDAATARVESLEAELAELGRSTADESADGVAEVAALKAELEARKTLIRSLRADAERVRQLESELESKREIISQLEGSINNHGETIAGLRRNSEAWRRKYQALKGGETSSELSAFTNTDIAAVERLEREAGEAPDKTVAIDVRGPLREARKRASDIRGR